MKNSPNYRDFQMFLILYFAEYTTNYRCLIRHLYFRHENCEHFVNYNSLLCHLSTNKLNYISSPAAYFILWAQAKERSD